MAHEIDFTTGKAGIAFIGDVPWHGYGQEVDPDAGLDQWRIAAGLDYEVEKRPVFFEETPTGEDQDPDLKEIPNTKALVRTDTESVLSVTTDRYQVHQPKDIVEFFRDLVDDHGFKMHTMGSLKEGRRIWAMADVGEDYTIMGQDRSHDFLLLSTGFDREIPTSARFTSVRVVCNNTLSYAESLGAHATQRHSSVFDPTAMRLDLDAYRYGLQLRQSQADDMAHYTLSPDQLTNYFFRVLQVTPLEQEAMVNGGTAPRPMRHLVNAFQNGPGADFRAANGTLWGAVNAVTYFQDHLSGSDAKRFNSSTFGNGNQRKDLAWKTATDMLQAA